MGYALIYYAGMDDGAFHFSSSGLGPSFTEAFYPSGTAISTVGFGDVTSTSGFYKLLSVSEGLIGFGILTLAVSYVIGVYGVLQRLGVLLRGCTTRPRTPTILGLFLPPISPGASRGPWSLT